MKGQCCIVRPVRMPQRGHGEGRLIRWRSQAGQMLGGSVARWDARGEFAGTTTQVLGERVAGAQSAWTGGGWPHPRKAPPRGWITRRPVTPEPVTAYTTPVNVY
jgi:hypothetical protein